MDGLCIALVHFLHLTHAPHRTAPHALTQLTVAALFLLCHHNTTRNDIYAHMLQQVMNATLQMFFKGDEEMLAKYGACVARLACG